MLPVDKLMAEITQHYPDEPIAAMRFIMDKYKVEDTIATHVVSVIWNQLHIKYPMNLPNFLLNPYAIYRN